MRAIVFPLILVALPWAVKADGQTAKEVMNASFDALETQSKNLVAGGFALYFQGESIESQSPGRSRSYETIVAAGPDYYYRGSNLRRIQETAPQITDINQAQFHVDNWNETVKFRGKPRLVRVLSDSMIYQPASVRESEPVTGTFEQQQPSLAKLLTEFIWGWPPFGNPGSEFDRSFKTQESLQHVGFDRGDVIAVFADEFQTTTVQFGQDVGFMPIQFNSTITVDGAPISDVEVEIEWGKVGGGWLPVLVHRTKLRGQNSSACDMTLTWKTGVAAPVLTPGHNDYRELVMPSFGKPHSRIVNGELVPRPYQTGRKSLFPLTFQRIPFDPTAGEPVEAGDATGDLDNVQTKVQNAIQVAHQAEQQIAHRFAVLIESECYKDTMSYSPVFTNRWAEQRIFSQLGQQWKYGAYNQISGPHKDKHRWEELLQTQQMIKTRTDLDRFPPGDVLRFKPYVGMPETLTMQQFLRTRRRVKPFYPTTGCFGGQSLFHMGWDVSRGVVNGELLAVRKHPDGSIRSYWQNVPSSSNPTFELRGVLIHNPETGYMPTHACWYGTYPSQMETEWDQHGDIYLPSMTRVIRLIGQGKDASEIQQVHVYRWLLGNEAPIELFDRDAADLRAPVMNFFERPFARMVPGKELREEATYETPPELALLPDPVNEASQSFQPFGE